METLRNIGAILSGVAALASLVSAVVNLKNRADLAEIMTYIEKTRREDADAIKKWAEEHFVLRPWRA
jgi:hypothetical protein